MIKFDLEKALAGDKVVTRDGREVTQLHEFTAGNAATIYGVTNNAICSWCKNGSYNGNGINTDLFMAPKKLSGFVNVDADGFVDLHSTKEEADASDSSDRIACIDLSQFEEGHGL